ncbi:hypothetical protein ABZ070_36920, partial [Streptomyces sp. NPDC006283]
YAALRDTAPVCPMKPPHGVETYLITRYEDDRAALSDPRLSIAMMHEWNKPAIHRPDPRSGFQPGH